MKKIYLLTIFLLFINILKAQHWTDLLTSNDPTFFEIQDAFNKYWDPYDVINGRYIENGIEKKAYGWKQFKRWEWYWELRVDVNGLFPKSDINYTEWQNYLENSDNLNNSSSSNWVYSGSNSSVGGYAGVGSFNGESSIIKNTLFGEFTEIFMIIFNYVDANIIKLPRVII